MIGAASRARARAAMVLAGASLLATGGLARADGLSGSAESTYASTRTTSTDQAGETTHTSATPWVGILRLAYDRALFPHAAVSAAGNYQLSHASSTSESGSSVLDQRIWNLSAGLRFGDPVLGGAVSYARRAESGESRSAQDVARSPLLISESYTASASWAPLDLPRLSLNASRSNNFDVARTTYDTVNSDVALAASYQPAERLDLHYTVRWSDSDNRLSGVDSSSIQNAASVSWGTSFLDRRGALNVSYNVGTIASAVRVAGAGGTVATQVFPIAGLSAVDTLPTLPTTVTLSQNTKLIDGDAAGGAGIDIGYSPRLSADDRLREVGVRLADATTQVNTVYVYVDKVLPFAVSGAYAWTAYRSRDNVNWAETPVTAVAFGEFQNRFELTIAAGASEYLKVATRPLQPAVTQEQRFAEILVTEVQALVVVPASAAAASELRVAGSFSTATRVRLLRTLAYDGSFGFSHNNESRTIPWTVQNGLSWADRLTGIVNSSARLERTDSSTSSGHTAEWRWSGALTADPLPTLGAGASYGGSLASSSEGRATTHALGVFSRQDLYPGVGLSENAAYGLNDNADGRRTTSFSASASASAQPHRKVALSVTWSYIGSTTTPPGQSSTSTTATRLDAGVSVNPVPALTGSASLSYFTGGIRPTTTYNLTASASPFPGGDLVLRFSYLESYDTATDVRTRQLGPTLRWNIGRLAFLDLAYNWLAYRSPALTVDTRTISATLVVRIR